MYLIISSVKIDKLMKYDYLNGGKMAREEYYNTPEAEEFLAITPLIIDPIDDKRYLPSKIAGDISWLSLCYNCPLNIYVMTDNWYYKNLKLLHLRSRRNFGKCSQMQNLHQIEKLDLNSSEIDALRVDINTTYYKGDYDTIEREFSKIVLDKSFNMRKNPIQYIRLTAKEGFRWIV